MIEVDTVKLNNCGNDIIKLSQDLSDLCNELYDRINNIPTVTHEWQGSSADAYVKKALEEKIQVVDFKDQLYAFGDNMVKSAQDYESSTIKIKFR